MAPSPSDEKSEFAPSERLCSVEHLLRADTVLNIAFLLETQPPPGAGVETKTQGGGGHCSRSHSECEMGLGPNCGITGPHTVLFPFTLSSSHPPSAPREPSPLPCPPPCSARFLPEPLPAGKWTPCTQKPHNPQLPYITPYVFLPVTRLPHQSTKIPEARTLCHSSLSADPPGCDPKPPPAPGGACQGQ